MEDINAMKEKTKKIIIISICFILFLILSLGVIYATNIISSKGELNDDDIIDYKDVSLLERHLIHIQDLPEDKISNADMNSDGKITVTDLSILIQKIENKISKKWFSNSSGNPIKISII